MKVKTLRTLFAGLLSLTALTALSGCNKFIDYAHNGSVTLGLEYQGHDFFVDGIGEVTLKSHIDGDTAHFLPITGHTSTVLKARFYGIDTPESTGAIEPYGKAASNFTKQKLKNAAENGTIVISSPSSVYAEPQADSTGSRYLSLVWINETVKHCAKEQLVLLNLWIVQEGLSWAKNLSSIPEYVDVFQNAQNQAEKHKLYLWSGKDDPDYNYGEYNETSLLDIKYEIAEFIEDQDHVNAFDGANVYFKGTVSGYANNSLYVQEFYPTDPEDPSKGGEYAGINIFTGMNAIPTKYTTVGAYLQVSGKAMDSENFGFQISDTHWPTGEGTDIKESKVLLNPEDNTGIHQIKTFEYTAKQIDEHYDAGKLDNLYCRTHISTPLVCSRVFINDSGETTLYFANSKVAVYMPFQYAGDPADTSSVWSSEDNFIGKTFDVTGVYAYHITTSKKITYQIIPSGPSDLVCLTPAHGTVQYNAFTPAEIKNLVDFSKDVTYYVTGVASEVTNSKVTLKDSVTGEEYAILNPNRSELSEKALGNLKAGSTVFAKGHIGDNGLVDSTLLAVYAHGAIDTDPLTLDEAIALASEVASDTVYVVGEITSIEKPYDSSEKNPRMSFSLNELKFVEGKLGTGVDPEDIVVGATVMLKGKLVIEDGVKTFSGLPQVYKVLGA